MHDTLQQVFGYPQFRLGQEETVSAVLAGRSAAAIFPTGSGKSLCYQLSAVLLPHLTLVVSPLLALMQDQLGFLQRHGISAGSIDSAQSREEANEVMARARSGELKILMISVERLKNERFRNFLQSVQISLLVVDEAHCISEWGHNFRPDYLKLPDYQRQFNIPQALLLTATATPRVIADMQAKFAIAPDDVVTTGFYRPNLNLLVEPVSGADKRRRLVQWMSERADQPSIVYVTLQKTAEQIAEHLNRNGIQAEAYHAGLPHDKREGIQQRFMGGRSNCIVASSASWAGAPIALLPPSRLAWASTRVISATWCISTCPSPSRTTARKSAARGVMGSRPTAWSWPIATASMCWKTLSTATRPSRRAFAGCCRSCRRHAAKDSGNSC